ncbi:MULTISPECIES: (2,3-dihydroxybenzoyl)adenylate synthase [Rhodococcus]|uniref:(2,3-dihydroxybenzoyl)adenylate synthase n=1 Tax=Rhodococcus oxybenzonivorans TaxID=1990687 RepID=A0AAE5A834_9NOCA|nr:MULTISPECIES: (2,3-dihydroxybenzoyl)adenylate synthase [Rhodococcus]MDV7240905.1 (2,3-dihydroxybenzoyl)adenylate synthase [Rhodococcus oxybenzonivorans]MDV7267171.1 (2,3-dihydroxybenzoyl)adenylate synthase [Rhodococcus oxybenzonivorans]MDV7273178.1 (2,3-dihydroxybenzoyl)adenylate synthase [Rhodococcus oxybenzonivorans]MDV7333084.1 (2,3-dihydroxybenzoyl)adenylate synthase [Rhodococcus oxybenzonivorans]MDV7342250.1 (2,3-dihydroxybenzoyl)adenylate synthase [Rhodococcus oxybenzonivorans]
MTTSLRAPLSDTTGYPASFAERYRQAGYWTDETFQQFLGARAAEFEDAVAVVGPDATGGETSLTYRQLTDRAGRLAAGLLESGIHPGDRVVVQLPNIVEYVEVVFALFRLGALPVFALPAHREHEVSYFCSFTDAAAYIVTDRHAGFDYRALARQVVSSSEQPPTVIVAGDAQEFVALDDLRGSAPITIESPVDAESVAFLQLSGGTTGVSKLIPRTHADYLYSVRESARICGVDEHTRMLVVLPAAHNFPMSSPGILGVLHAGGRVVLAPDPSPDTAFALIEREGITMASLVPPLALAWLAAAARTERDLSSLEVLQVGGAKFSAEAAKRVRPELGCTVQQVFGMAEGLVNYTRLDDPESILVSTQGRPISPDDEVLVVDDHDVPVPAATSGHLLTRGPYTIRGYYRAPEHNSTAFTDDGFYRTGDIVRLTDDGYLVVEGRAKDQINRGGEKVAAEEVENHLLAHPRVADVAVVSMPDPYLGERTCAFVVVLGEQPTQGELKKFVRGRGLAEYKVPDKVMFVEHFPVTGVGKISKSELRRALEKTLVTP